MSRFTCLFYMFVALAISGCCPDLARPKQGAFAVDAGGRLIRSLEVGSSLQVAARGLQPSRLYEFRLGTDGQEITHEEAISFARVGADRDGEITPFILQYHSGVVGCSPRIKPRQRLPRYMYRTFDEAEKALSGERLVVSIHPVEPNPSGKIPLMKLRVGKPITHLKLPVMKRKSPMVYPSDAEGCLLNSSLTQQQDMYISGRNFQPGEIVQISVVPNQRKWHVGDVVNDITGVGGTGAPERIKVDQNGRFTNRVWDKEVQRRGTYDIIAQRSFDVPDNLRYVRATDIISYGSDTGYILFMRYPVGGPTMDIAGRPMSRSPYFQFSDSFAEKDDTVWGAVDPTYVPDGHPGGKYAAYYVVNHRDVDGWDPTAGGAINLVDVSKNGQIEIMPVKAGCVNGTDIEIWEPPLTLGEYDVVVDFGDSPAETETDYATDSQYDANYDFLDGADQIGFVVAKDPYEVAQAPYVPGETYPIGRAEYSQDDYFSSIGGADNIDLRAIVRYPATAAGDNTPVASGQHPIFFIEHGNHGICEQRYKDAYLSLSARQVEYQKVLDEVITYAQYMEIVLNNHETCAQNLRTVNHKGYMGLLDILASHGIIAVSIDAFDLTGSFYIGVQQWPVERGTLILKHIQLWSHLNDPSTYSTYPDFFSGRFNNHVDMSKISVSGHSRGGEASVVAYLLNSADPSEYGFSIGSVSSIAPMDIRSYDAVPSNDNVLPDVPYFVIIPAADGDVDDLYGVGIYDRAGRDESPSDSTTKSGVNVYGANHNFFNTVWADDWDDSWYPRDDYIVKGEQQRLGEAYLAAFTRVHLNNEVVYEDMLRGRLIFPSTAGFKIYHFRHEKNHSKIEDGGGTHVTAPTSPATAAATNPVSGPSVHVTQALKVDWSASTDQLVYSVPAGQRDASSFEVLSFRVAQTNSTDNPASSGQDFVVELVGGGKTKATWASNFDQIPKPYDREYSDHNVMTTVRIPLHSFIMNKSGVTLDNIDTIRFRFSNPSKGEIYVDDIEFSR